MTCYPLVRTGVVLAVLAVAAAPSGAQDEEVISIKGGTFEVQVLEDTNEIRIHGTQGFVMRGRVQLGFNYDAVEQCKLPECTPGAVISLSDVWSGSDFALEGKLRGIRYSGDGGMAAETSGRVAFSAAVTMPPMSDGPMSVSAPFEFAGLVSIGGNVWLRAVLVGGGHVTVTLVPNPFFGGDTWMIQRIVFTFRPVAQR